MEPAKIPDSGRENKQSLLSLQRTNSQKQLSPFTNAKVTTEEATNKSQQPLLSAQRERSTSHQFLKADPSQKFASSNSQSPHFSSRITNFDEKDKEKEINKSTLGEGSTTEITQNTHKTYFVQTFYTDGALSNIDGVKNWRVSKRTRTVGIGVVLAMNFKTSPPDAPPSPRARKEAWIIPSKRPGDRSVELIADAIKHQYLQLFPKSKKTASCFYQQALDPGVDSVKTIFTSLRQSAGDHRILFHYNGHGVPSPTNCGEFWVFNRELSQYVPLSLYDLQSWCKSPMLYVFDCSNSGVLLEWLVKFAEQREHEHKLAKQSYIEENKGKGSAFDENDYPKRGLPNLIDDFIAVGACRADEALPSSPDLPADLFTCCLQTPIQLSLYWQSKKSILAQTFTSEKIDYQELIKKIPGTMTDRSTPLGELSWIFTAITDTIAWESLPADLFRKLFREDAVVASIFRNFLLADRILRSSLCTPVSLPKLPCTHYHPLWSAWDHILDLFLYQLPIIIDSNHFEKSEFFEEQIRAFEQWLDLADPQRSPPRQLPIILQALLSPSYRIRALELFCKFVDFGVWAVNLSLSVGIYHYAIMLLSKATGKLANLLLFLWTKLLAVDHSLQEDLVKANGNLFFIQVLADKSMDVEHRIQAAFVLSVIMHEFPKGQRFCQQNNLIEICSSLLNYPHAKLRYWVLISLGKIWEDNQEIKNMVIQNYKTHIQVCSRITDQSPEVRAAALYALGTFIHTGTPSGDLEINLARSLDLLVGDISPIVRRELIYTISYTIAAYEAEFRSVVLAIAKQETQIEATEEEKNNTFNVLSSDYGRIWKIFFSLQFDPFPNLLLLANKAVVCIHSLAASELLIQSSAGSLSDQQVELLHAHLMQVTALQSRTFKNQINLSSQPTNSTSNPSESSSSFNASATPPTANPASKNNKRVENLVRHLQDWRKSAKLTINIGSGNNSNDNTPTSSNDLHQTAKSISPAAIRSKRRSVFATPQGIIPSNANTADIKSANHRTGTAPTKNYKPAKSCLFQWSCETFNNTLLSSNTPINDKSIHIRNWKMSMSSKFQTSVLSSRENIATNKFDTQISTLVNEPHHVHQILIHPHFPSVISAGESDLNIWDYQSNSKINSFNNLNINGSFISSMSLINENEENDKLMVASTDGIIRVWGNYWDNPNLITAWRAHSKPVPATRLCNLWDQSTGTVITAGPYPVIRLFDIEQGMAIQDIPVGGGTITSMTLASIGGNIIITGGSDGILRSFDYRVASRAAMIKTYSEHQTPIINVEVRQQSYQMASGAAAGDVRYWDMRSTSSNSSFKAHSRSEMAFMAVHKYIPIVATATQHQTVKISNNLGDRLGDIKYYSKYFDFKGSRVDSISVLSFHPYRPILAVGGRDGVVSVYRSNVYHI